MSPARKAASAFHRDRGARHFIAGLGDSVASGEKSGPADRAADEALLPLLSQNGAAQYYRRAAPAIRRTRCGRPIRCGLAAAEALWFNPACHRSLYSYQTRTALALAVSIRTSR
jgi:hypothetical protein